MADIIKSLEWRYAVKKFDEDRSLPQESIMRLKEAFNLTATSYGLQPITLLVVKNKGLQQRLAAHSYGQQQVAQASHVLVICIRSTINGQYIRAYFNRVRKIRGTPDKVLAPFEQELVNNFSRKSAAEIKGWAKNQAYLALGSLLAVCAVEKIDSCPMEGFVPDAYGQELRLSEKGLLPVLVLPVGYRAEDDMFANLKKVRKELDDSVVDINV